MTEQKPIDQRIQDLINGGVDDELSPVEQKELDGLLDNSAQIRDLNEELKAFADLLEELPEVEPPQYLQESIERQIRLPVQSIEHEEKQSVLGTWLPAHWLRTGFALAAGIVLTVGVYEMGSGPMTAEDAGKLVGTVVKNPSTDQGELLDSFRILTDTLDGQVELRSKGDLFTVDVELNSEGPTQVVVDFAGRGLVFEGITQSQNREDAVSLTEGAIRVASSGEKRYTLNLRRLKESEGQETAPLELDFFANQTLIHEAELNITKH
jgi:hypothetical protein